MNGHDDDGDRAKRCRGTTLRGAAPAAERDAARQWWLRLARLLGLAWCALVATTCATATPTPGTLSASGVVTLPAGFKLSFSELTVSSALGGVTVGGDGSFTVQEPPGGGPATVLVTGPSGA
jgi:hypothetical protein